MKNLKRIATLFTAVIFTSSCSNIKSPSASNEVISNSYTVNCPTPIVVIPPKTPKYGHRINVDHIFCGEFNKTSAVGFHSAPNGNIPPTVIILKPKAGTLADDKNTTSTHGFTPQSPLKSFDASTPFTLYNFNIRINKVERNKEYSSMFPSQCTAEQVIASISNVADQVAKPTQGSKKTGDSAPKPSLNTHCYSNGAIFKVIVFFTVETDPNTKQVTYVVNSAYPDIK